MTLTIKIKNRREVPIPYLNGQRIYERNALSSRYFEFVGDKYNKEQQYIRNCIGVLPKKHLNISFPVEFKLGIINPKYHAYGRTWFRLGLSGSNPKYYSIEWDVKFIKSFFIYREYAKLLREADLVQTNALNMIHNMIYNLFWKKYTRGFAATLGFLLFPLTIMDDIFKTEYASRIVAKYCAKREICSADDFPSKNSRMSPSELWPDLFSIYLTQGRDFRAQPEDSTLGKVYRIMKNEIFDGIEYR